MRRAVIVTVIIIVINMVVTYNSNSLLLLPCHRSGAKREKGEWTRSAVLYKRVKIV